MTAPTTTTTKASSRPDAGHPRRGRPDAKATAKPDAKPALTLDDRIRGALASPPAPSDWPTHKARAGAAPAPWRRERARGRRRVAG